MPQSSQETGVGRYFHGRVESIALRSRGNVQIFAAIDSDPEHQLNSYVSGRVSKGIRKRYIVSGQKQHFLDAEYAEVVIE